MRLKHEAMEELAGYFAGLSDTIGALEFEEHPEEEGIVRAEFEHPMNRFYVSFCVDAYADAVEMPAPN